MSVSQEEMMYLQAQLEGLESIFLELMPCGVELKRQQVQDYYDKRFDQATKPMASVAETELRRQFNTKANQVRNLVDSAESLGDAASKLNLIRAAATLADERSRRISPNVLPFCQELLTENQADPQLLRGIISSSELSHIEARILLGSVMFLVAEAVDNGGRPLLVRDLLSELINKIAKERLLSSHDPFLVEAQCALEAMDDESA